MNIKLRPDKDIKAETMRVGRVPVLVLRPVSRPASDTAVLWIHGGGYFLGMKEMVHMSRAADLVRKFGVTVFSPGYRLALLSPYPAAFDDCFSVLEFINERRKELNVSRIMVGGESAGGGLCAAVCMKARDRGIHVAYQMPLYPMMSNVDTASSKDNHGRIWNTRKNHLGWRLYLRRYTGKSVSPYASPSSQTDYTNLAPCYTFVGDGEPFHDETLNYVENLKNAGVEASVNVYHTDMHAFDMLYPDREPGITAIADFEKHFEQALEKYN